MNRKPLRELSLSDKKTGKPLQKDLFDEAIYYYDLHNDPAKLGTWRDLLKVDDTFNWDGHKYVIIDKNAADQHWMIERVSG